MKRMMLISVCAAIVLLANATLAKADVFNLGMVFRADNFVDSVVLSGGEKPVVFADAVKTDRWSSSETFSSQVSLERNKVYTITWDVRNVPLDAPDNNGSYKVGDKYPVAIPTVESNPMAFLGQLTIGNATFSTRKDNVWSIVGEDLFTYGANAAGQTWSQGAAYHPWTLVSGINQGAEWIGSRPNGQDNDGKFQVKATFRVAENGDIVATPIPGAAWLLGAGLMGLMGFRRKIAA